MVKNSFLIYAILVWVLFQFSFLPNGQNFHHFRQLQVKRFLNFLPTTTSLFCLRHKSTNLIRVNIQPERRMLMFRCILDFALSFWLTFFVL